MSLRNILVIGLCCVLGLSSTNGQDYKIVFYESAKPTYIDPVYGGQTMLGQRVVSLLFRPLYGPDVSLRIVPYITTEYPTETETPMQQTMVQKVVFSLKPDLTWHDEKPLTSKDVIHTFNLLRREEEYGGHPFLQAFSGFSRSGDYEITALLEPGEAFDINMLTFPLLPQHWTATGTITKSSNFTTREPIGNGPFKIKKNKIDRIVFERFDGFRKSAAEKLTNIKEIVLKASRVKATWAPDMISGVANLLPVVPTKQIDDLKGIGNVILYPYANFSVEMIGFNFRNPLLKERFIRHAFYYAYDRSKAIEAHLGGQGDLLTGPYPAGSVYYWLELERYPYDPDKAIELLEKRCEKGQDNIYTFQGKRLSFRIMGSQNNEKFKDEIQSFRKAMKKVGIEIQNPEPYEPNNYQQHMINRDFDLIWIVWVFDESLDISFIYHSEGSQNYFGYNNPRVDGKFGQLEGATDPIMRIMIGNEIHKELHKDPPGLFLWTEKRYSAYDRRIERFEIHPIDYFNFVHEWRMTE